MNGPHYVIQWRSRAMKGSAFWYYGPGEVAAMEAHRENLLKRGCEVTYHFRCDPEAYCLAFDEGKAAGAVQRLEDGVFGGTK